MSEIDFAAEGLLDGLEGEAREARLDLLRALAADGVELEELRAAIAEERLALLPVERSLAGDYVYTVEEVAEKAGISQEFLRGEIQAMGLPVPEPGERMLTEQDLEAAHRAKVFLDAGLPEEGIFEVARVIGNSMARLAATTQGLIGNTFLQPGDTERDLAFRYAEVSRLLSPVLGSTLEWAFERHLHELVRQAVVSRAELESGELPGAQEVAAAFADLVGFTRLGERVEVGQIGEVTGRFIELATSAARSPVQLVKTIGDAAMLVSNDPAALLGAVIDLVEAVESDESLPSVKAGAAWGQALSRGGDWYGRPVNLASRITDVARPGSVLVAEELAKRLDGEGFRFSPAGAQHFKGIRGNVKLKRARR